jgi:hypothetical protein
MCHIAAKTGFAYLNDTGQKIDSQTWISYTHKISGAYIIKWSDMLSGVVEYVNLLTKFAA